MLKFLKAFKLLTKLYKRVDTPVYDDVDALREDFKFVAETLFNNMPEFPYYVDRGSIEAVLKESIDEKQKVFADEWVDMEPRMKYENEWDGYEVMDEFEEYLIHHVARVASDRLLEVARDDIEAMYRDNLRHQTKRKNIMRLYEKAKHGKTDV